MSQFLGHFCWLGTWCSFSNNFKKVCFFVNFKFIFTFKFL